MSTGTLLFGMVAQGERLREEGSKTSNDLAAMEGHLLLQFAIESRAGKDAGLDTTSNKTQHRPPTPDQKLNVDSSRHERKQDHPHPSVWPLAVKGQCQLGTRTCT